MKVSTAAKYWQSINEAPASVTIITSTQIKRYGYRTLEDVLRNVRGFYTSYDRNYSYIGVRGFSRPTDYNDRLLLLLDGHTLNENVYGSAMMGSDLPIDLSSLERIEIVRGPGSALYGTGAMFAVVNLIPLKGNSLDNISVSGELGSFGRKEGTAYFGKQFQDDVSFLFSVRGANIDGDDHYYSEFDSLNSGVAHNLDWEKYAGVLSSFRYKQLTLHGMFTSREKSVPTGAYGVEYNAPGFTTLDKRAFLELKYDQALTVENSLMLRGYYDFYDYRGSAPYLSFINHDASTGKWFGAEAQLRWDVFRGNRLTAGTEAINNLHADYRNGTEDTAYFDKNFPFTVFSVYLQDEYQIFENFSLTIGLRRDEYSSAGSSTTPRVALVYNPTTTSTLKLLYGEGFRAPNVYESNYEDPITNWRSNPALLPEKIRTTEVVLEQRMSNAIFALFSIYRYSMSDLIDPVQDTGGFTEYRNISTVDANGSEIEINFRTEIGLNGSFSYSYQGAEDPDQEKRLSNLPPDIARVGLSYQLYEDITIAGECIYNSKRITVYNTTTSPFLLTNVNILVEPQVEESFLPGSIMNHFKVSLLINNIFNTAYSTPGGFEHVQSSILQDGRNFRFFVGFTF